MFQEIFLLFAQHPFNFRRTNLKKKFLGKLRLVVICPFASTFYHLMYFIVKRNNKKTYFNMKTSVYFN